MHEWLSGGVPPCQGGGRGSESRLVLDFLVSQMFKYIWFLFYADVTFLINSNIIYYIGKSGRK